MLTKSNGFYDLLKVSYLDAGEVDQESIPRMLEDRAYLVIVDLMGAEIFRCYPLDSGETVRGHLRQRGDL